MKRPALLLSLPLFAAMVVATPARAAECFSMFDARNVLVSQSTDAPIDLSHSISNEMAAHFPARYLVIADTGGCPEVDRPIGTVADAAPTRGFGRSRPVARRRSSARS